MAKGKQRSLIKRPKTANAGAMKKILETSKYETVVLGQIQKHIISSEDEPRDQTVLHPSEMAKPDWCHRRSFYVISPEHPAPAVEDHGHVLQNIFDEGHFVHGKYQSRLWDMGLLRGWFRCHLCTLRWYDTSPQECPECGAPRGGLEYREVPLRDPEHLLGGHADGDLALTGIEADDPLLEVKTIGEGTVRHEYPNLLWEYSTTTVDGKAVVDLNGLWGAIKRPFPSHIRQAMLYLHMAKRKRMVFIYECKWNQATKEFVVRFRPEVVEPLLDLALDVKYALKVNRPPERPGWATPDDTRCTACEYRAVCHNLENSDGENQPGDEAGRGGRGRAQVGAAGRDEPAGEAEVRRADAPPPARRVVRRRTDAPAGGVHPVD